MNKMKEVGKNTDHMQFYAGFSITPSWLLQCLQKLNTTFLHDAIDNHDILDRKIEGRPIRQ